MRTKILVLISALLLPGSFASQASTPDSADVSQISMLEASAAAGDEKAQLNLARRYLVGSGVEADTNKSIIYYRLAAERGIAFAQHQLGLIYLSGQYLEPDPAAAERWLLQAAHLGYRPAQLDLSDYYATGMADAPLLVPSLQWLLIAESLGEAGLSDRIEELNSQMTYLQRAEATLLARLCILRGYSDC